MTLARAAATTAPAAAASPVTRGWSRGRCARHRRVGRRFGRRSLSPRYLLQRMPGQEVWWRHLSGHCYNYLGGGRLQSTGGQEQLLHLLPRPAAGAGGEGGLQEQGSVAPGLLLLPPVPGRTDPGPGLSSVRS